MISASYRFPKDFIWGTGFHDDDYSSAGLLPLLHQMETAHARYLLLRISWDVMETGDSGINESRIDTVRKFLQTIHHYSMEPVILFDNGTLPEVLAAGRHSGQEKEEAYLQFAKHLIDAFRSYSRYWIPMIHPAGIRVHRREDSYFRIQKELYAYLHQNNEKVSVGIGLHLKQRHTSDFTNRFRYTFLHDDFPADFVGLSLTSGHSESAVRLIGSYKKPLLIFGEKEQSPAPDLLFSLWNLYREGIPVMGYLPNKSVFQEDTPDSCIFRETIRANALDISTDREDLPEKWRNFLKD